MSRFPLDDLAASPARYPGDDFAKGVVTKRLPAPTRQLSIERHAPRE